jgi:hypothetical protein
MSSPVLPKAIQSTKHTFWSVPQDIVKEQYLVAPSLEVEEDGLLQKPPNIENLFIFLPPYMFP